MNSVRATSQGKNKKGRNGLPSLSAAARQLGLDQDELGEEAEQLWKMLNDLSENDPDAYQRVLREQAEQMNKPSGGTIVPVYAFTLRFKDCIRKSDSCNKTVYVNCCSHRAVDPPLDPSGTPIDVGDRNSPSPAPKNLSGITIPLAVGPAREVRNEQNVVVVAVDVLVHPWVVHIIKQNNFFKIQVVDLINDHVTEDLGIRLPKEYKEMDINGPGAVADPTIVKCRPVPFSINKNGTDSKDAGDAETLGTPNNPQDLIRMMHQQRDKSQEQDGVLLSSLKVTETKENVSDAAKSKSPLVSEVTKSSGKPPRIKKGFLNNNNSKPLYPETGSENGGPKTFLDRAKIVNMNHDSLSPASNTNPESPATSKPTAIPAKVTKQDLTTSTATGNQARYEPNVPVVCEEFDRLAAAFDEDLSKSNIASSQTLSTEEALAQSKSFIDALGALSGEGGNWLAGSEVATEKPATSSSRQQDSSTDVISVTDTKETVDLNAANVTGSEEHDLDATMGADKITDTNARQVVGPLTSIRFNMQVENSTSDCPKTFKCVLDLSKVDDLSNVDVQVSATCARVDAKPWYLRTEIQFPFEVGSAISAKFKKNKKQLVIKGQSSCTLR